MRFTIYLFVVLYLILPVTIVLAADKDSGKNYPVIENLNEQWQVYDTDYKSYVPYLQRLHGSPAAIHLELNLDNYKGYHLLLTTPQPLYLFIQAQLNRPLAENQEIVFNIDSLRKKYKQPKLLFSLYTKSGHSTMPSVSVVYKIEELSTHTAQSNLTIPLKPRNQTDLQNFTIIAAIIILAIFAFLWNYHPMAFNGYYNMRPIFNLSVKEDTVLISRPLSRISLLFIFNHSLLLAFLYILLQKSSGKLLLNDQFLQSAHAFPELFYYFCLLTFVIFLLIIGKYFFLYLLGSLFNLSNVVYIHFYEYLLFSRIFYSIIVPLTFCFYLIFPNLISTVTQDLIYAIIIFNFIRLFIINFALNKLTSVRNLYLFSYLCATELTPLLVGIKILIE